MASSPAPPLRTRAFRFLLSLYPGEFRDEYGRELALVFADRYRDAPTAWKRALVWGEAIGGVLREAPREHAHVVTQDLRYAVRVLLRTPAFCVTALLTLALGIGATTAIFQLIDAIGLRQLPVPAAHELAEVRIVGGNQGFGLNPGYYGQLTQPVWNEIRGHQEAFSGVFAWGTRELRTGQGADLRRASGIAVSGEFFAVLGIRPWRGRLLQPEDTTAPCQASRAVVSHAFWQAQLNGRELTSDTRLAINGTLHDIIGVTPPEFFGLAVGERFDVALPLCTSLNARREVFDVAVMGRLRPDWTIARASAHLNALSTGIFEAAAPTGYNAGSTERFKQFRLAAYPAGSGVSRLRTEFEASLRLLLAISGLVLLIACANLANLTMARATARAREVAVRLALGASRTRLVRQFVAESCVLALVGAALGVGLAQILSRVLVWGLSNDAVVLSLTLSWRVLVFAAAMAVGTCVVFGVAPAFRATHIEPTEAMKTGGRGLSAGRDRLAVQRSMVVMQIAISLVLFVAALMFVRSFRNLVTFDPGIRQDGISIAFLGFPSRGKLPAEQISDFQRQLVAEIQSVPGVRNAAMTSNVPLLGSSWSHGIHVDQHKWWARFTWVSPSYFETVGIPILRGRGFTLHDTRSTPRVAVVNQAFVRRFAPDRDPIGRTLETQPEPDYPATEYEIVGVIPDTKYNSLRNDSELMVFAPDSQHPTIGPWAAMMIHSSTEPATAIAGVKRLITERHSDVFAEFDVFKSRIHEGLVRERLLAILAGLFGVLAAILAMVGLYGLIAFAVAERRHEIGIRIALGADAGQVVGMMMRGASRLLIVGLILGVGASLWATPAAATLLFGLEPHDPPTLIGACLLLTIVTAAASFIPARDASRLDPVVALRQE
jgi:predicted permease